jgi:uncharacterized protein (DUF58 family)
MTMGSAGKGLYRFRIAIRVIIIVIAGFLVAAVQPMNVGSVIWASVIVGLLLLALELLQRPPVVVAKPVAKKAATTKRATPTKRATSART